MSRGSISSAEVIVVQFLLKSGASVSNVPRLLCGILVRSLEDGSRSDWRYWYSCFQSCVDSGMSLNDPVVLSPELNENLMMGFPLHFACSSCNVDLMRLLLKHSADPNLRQVSNQHTPLHVLCHSGGDDDDDLVTQGILLLLAYGANINALTERGYTPLCVASAQNSLQACVCLLRNDADPNIRSQIGLIAKDLTTTPAIKFMITQHSKGTVANGSPGTLARRYSMSAYDNNRYSNNQQGVNWQQSDSRSKYVPARARVQRNRSMSTPRFSPREIDMRNQQKNKQ